MDSEQYKRELMEVGLKAFMRGGLQEVADRLAKDGKQAPPGLYDDLWALTLTIFPDASEELFQKAILDVQLQFA